ncbi:MAG TPA: hypothetical protein PKE08_02955, partial [Candidatus Paceibacterota bacterium]|nr:hypothetical protein [Candidatus Paceibacterota bacterium]
IMTLFGLLSTAILSVFFISFINFILRAKGPMAQMRVGQIITNFPWWMIIVVAISLWLGLKIIKKYDFIYKIDNKILLSIFLITTLLGGIFVDLSGFNRQFIKKGGPMRGAMQRYLKDENIDNNLKKCFFIKQETDNLPKINCQEGGFNRKNMRY